MNNKPIKIPKERPILRYTFLAIFLVCMICPIIIIVTDFMIKNNNEANAKKLNETVGTVESLTVTTDSRGNAISYNTKVHYTIKDKRYAKTFNTNYFIADETEQIKMYYEPGNPYSASVTTEQVNFTDEEKKTMFIILSVLAVAVCIIKGYEEAVWAKKKQISRAEQQIVMQHLQRMNNVDNRNMF